MQIINALLGASSRAPAPNADEARARSIVRGRLIGGAMIVMLALLALIIARPARAQEASSALEWAARQGDNKTHSRSHVVARGEYRARFAPLDVRSAPQIVAEAARYIGSRNPMRFAGPGCKAFVNMVARRTGYAITASARAFDTRGMGQRVAYPQPGDYRVSARRGGGHVEIVASVDGGSVTTINGNKGRNRVGWSHRSIAGAAYYRPIRVASI